MKGEQTLGKASIGMEEYPIAWTREPSHLSPTLHTVRNRTEVCRRRNSVSTIKMQKIYYHILGCRGSACSLQNAISISRCANAKAESEHFSLSQRMYSVLQLVPYHVGDLQDAE
jgi:hypothetical protein